ncbi:hypothetical protein ACFFLZ_10425, partial [Photobacterium aphoticum]|uniref:hypothetical protein n=1 Tax=Photobacterium aphoticum TaxID=754436 RepID=UPI0035EC1FE6
ETHLLVGFLLSAVLFSTLFFLSFCFSRDTRHTDFKSNNLVTFIALALRSITGIKKTEHIRIRLFF